MAQMTELSMAQITELVAKLKALGVEQFELEGVFKVAFASEALPEEESSSHVSFMADSPTSSDEDEEDLFGSK
jgi:hypothetical protein